MKLHLLTVCSLLSLICTNFAFAMKGDSAHEQQLSEKDDSTEKTSESAESKPLSRLERQKKQLRQLGEEFNQNHAKTSELKQLKGQGLVQERRKSFEQDTVILPKDNPEISAAIRREKDSKQTAIEAYSQAFATLKKQLEEEIRKNKQKDELKDMLRQKVES